tara:strand:- start:3394 stop:3810 length:417 start_codon:yes stop_codon:yes gene_type:complete
MKQFQEVYNALLKKINDTDSFELNPHNLIVLLKMTIELVEFLELSGREKKSLVIDLLKKYVNESKINETEKQICLDMINNGTISETIDLVIDASNGILDINNVIDLGSSCCAILLKNLLERRDKKRKNKKRNKVLLQK